VRAGAHVARHDVRVDWQTGHAERNTEALWGNIRRLMQEISIEISTTDSTPSSTD